MSQRPGDRIARRPAPPARPPKSAGRLTHVVITADREHTFSARVVRYGLTGAVLALVTAGLIPLREVIGLLNIGLVYLIIVIGATVLAGRWAGILASCLGFALFDFFLVPPYINFSVAELYNILALFVFLGVSALLSWLIANAREQAAEAQRRAEDVSRLYELTQAIIGTQRPEDALPAIARKISEVFAVQACWILLPGPDGRLQVQAQAPTEARPLNRDEQALADWVFGHGSAAGQGRLTTPGFRDPTPSTGTVFVPLQAGGRTLGVLGVAHPPDQQPLTMPEYTVLATFADQTAVALDRLTLLREAQRAELLDRADELKSALMSAVSHDLRTPLASIIAAVTSLLEPEMQWPEATRRDFLQGIYEEAQRLNRLVGNLLDMSRIEGGALHPEKDWYSIDEVITAVVTRLESRLARYQVTVEIAPDLPLIPLDFTEIDQVMTNVLENALKYTPLETAIRITAGRQNEAILVSVADSGPGVPPEHLARLFDKFYRVDGLTRPQGMGLGLAISKGLIEAHGGKIMAQDLPAGGLEISFTLPIPPAAWQADRPEPIPARSNAGA